MWKIIKTKKAMLKKSQRCKFYLYRDVWVEALAAAIDNSCRLQRLGCSRQRLCIENEGMHAPTGKQFRICRCEWYMLVNIPCSQQEQMMTCMCAAMMMMSSCTGALSHRSSKMKNTFRLDSAAVVQNSVILLRTIDGCCDQHTLAWLP